MSSNPEYSHEPGSINRVKRLTDRARYDQKSVFEILDAGVVAHVGFVVDGRTVVMPMAYGRIGEDIYIHGYVSGRLLKNLSANPPATLTVTLVDGLVLAMGAFHNSMNYRSVCVFGDAELVTDPKEKEDGLRAVTDHLLPGRYDSSRPATSIELKSTTLLKIPISTASCKIRTGPPGDDKEDEEDAELTSRMWTGVIEMETKWTGLMVGGAGKGSDEVVSKLVGQKR